MPIIRANVELQHDSGLPRDKVVNSFHVSVNDLLTATIEPVAEKISMFYTTKTGAQVEPLQDYLGTQIADTGHAVKIYDQGTAGSPPNHTEAFDFLGRTPVGVGSGNAPSDVAICLSYRNESVTTTVPPRRRGRIYLGPIRNGATNFADASTPAPSSQFITDVLIAAEKLKADLLALASPAVWVVWSPTASQSFPIERFWIDNAFDTQRRRGERASARTWSPAL